MKRAGAVVELLVPLALVALQATRDSPSLPVAFSVLAIVAGALAALLIPRRGGPAEAGAGELVPATASEPAA